MSLALAVGRVTLADIVDDAINEQHIHSVDAEVPDTLDSLSHAVEAAYDKEVSHDKGIPYYTPEKREISTYRVARIGNLTRGITDVVLHDLDGHYQLSIFEDEKGSINRSFENKEDALRAFNYIKDMLQKKEARMARIHEDLPADDIFTLVTDDDGYALIGIAKHTWDVDGGPGAYARLTGKDGAVSLRVVEDDKLGLVRLNGWMSAAKAFGFDEIIRRLEGSSRSHEYSGMDISQDGIALKMLTDGSTLYGRGGIYAKKVAIGAPSGYREAGFALEFRELEKYQGEYIFSVRIEDPENPGQLIEQTYYHKIDSQNWTNISRAREMAAKDALACYTEEKSLKQQMAVTEREENEWCLAHNPPRSR